MTGSLRSPDRMLCNTFGQVDVSVKAENPTGATPLRIYSPSSGDDDGNHVRESSVNNSFPVRREQILLHPSSQVSYNYTSHLSREYASAIGVVECVGKHRGVNLNDALSGAVIAPQSVQALNPVLDAEPQIIARTVRGRMYSVSLKSRPVNAGGRKHRSPQLGHLKTNQRMTLPKIRGHRLGTRVCGGI